MLSVYRLEILLAGTLIILSGGCRLSSPSCVLARGPIMFGAPCGSCKGCGETDIDHWINHPPSRIKEVPGCDHCDSGCNSCRPIRSSLERVLGHGAQTKLRHPCDSSEAICGIEASGNCNGCAKCGPQEIACGVEEVTCGLHETTRGITIVRSPSTHFHSTQPTERLDRQPTSAEPIRKAATVRGNYPLDTPRIYKNRSNPQQNSSPARL